LNINPNGVAPSQSNPNLILVAVQSNLAKAYLNLGFGNIGGTVQYTQHDAWNGAHNNYEWRPQEWDDWYGMLRDIKLMMARAEEIGSNFHYGAGLVLRAFVFGTITDLWGDCPYTEAVKGDENDQYLKPKYDSQSVIYPGIIADLEAAIEMFASDKGIGVVPEYDIYYNGDSGKWIKFAGSLLLRYYMRLSAKDPLYAWEGIQKVYSSGNYFRNAGDDATMGFIGIDKDDSWPTAYELDRGEGFRRRRMCKTLFDILDANSDPRKEIWIDKVHCRWVADTTLTVKSEFFIRKNGVLTNMYTMDDTEYIESIDAGNLYTRHFHPDTFSYDTGEYVAVPPHLLLPGIWNGNPRSTCTIQNQHVSQLGRIYREKTGDLLLARLCSYAEVCFIFAEAAFKGANVGLSAKQWYEIAIEGSLDTWGVGDDYAYFIVEPGVAYNGTHEQIMEQKWVAGWTAGTEAWFDFRRTGLPDFPVKRPAAGRAAMPLRFAYGDNERNLNSLNYKFAIMDLEETQYSAPQGKDSPWSKMWLLQGTGKPW
jgi:hypothetical protein